MSGHGLLATAGSNPPRIDESTVVAGVRLVPVWGGVRTTVEGHELGRRQPSLHTPTRVFSFRMHPLPQCWTLGQGVENGREVGALTASWR